MTRKEIVQLLVGKGYGKKTDLNTIKDIISIGQENGYEITKSGIDSFEIRESCAIRDFTKPLNINREIPPLISTEHCNNIPLGQIIKEIDCYENRGFSYEVYCYLYNKQTGDFINFEDFRANEQDVARAFDLMFWKGFISETETEIEFCAYKKSFDRRIPYDYILGESIRLAPIIR